MATDIQEDNMGVITDPKYLRCLDASGNSKVVTPENVLIAAGKPAGIITKFDLVGGKWYRIAIGATCNTISSALINIGNSYHIPPFHPNRIFFMFLQADTEL